MLNWIVDERWSAQVSPTEVYRVTHPPGAKYVALHVLLDFGGASRTENIGEFEGLEEAIQKAEEHAKTRADAPKPATKEVKGIPSTELIGKHGKTA
jgi:hypothetical protein